ncbi:MAG TPA: ABC transporter ATP-binding protein [Thermomicrobiales bacterium]|nr:ABC transporter ATP-binding protein [Thermomicrobiales bacterium]
MSTPREAGGQPDLEARDVSKRYGHGVVALEHLDIAIAPSTTTALVGPNGAGKSTLMKLWMGFERPTSGSLSVRGWDPWRQRAHAVAVLGYVPQSVSLYRDLTIGDHLDLALSLRPTFDRPYATARLARLGITTQRDAGELSGGEQSQVALALALGTRAPVLLLDEPLASLDPLARREFLAVVGDVARTEGVTVVLSSHIVTDVESSCERIVVLGAGRVLVNDSVAMLLASHLIRVDNGVAGPHVATCIGGFPGPAGEALTLWQTSGPAVSGYRRPTLEEVVMGYVSAGRRAME